LIALVRDIFVRGRHAQADGSMVHDMLLARIKTPARLKRDWDQYEVIGTIPGRRRIVRFPSANVRRH
jgi:branched-chain amino acid transport system substrate-binding protein